MTRPNNPDNLRTSINVKRTTRDKLNNLRDYPREYLDSVIKRLINNNKKKEIENDSNTKSSRKKSKLSL